MSVSINYNTVPRRPHGQKGIHWIVTLMEGLRHIATKKIDLSVSREMRDEWVMYSIHSKTQKAKILAYAKGNRIYLEFYRLGAPDITQIRRPRYGDFEAHGSFKMGTTTGGFIQATNFILSCFESGINYADKAYPRIKICSDMSKVDNHTVFFGGEIRSVVYEGDRAMSLTIEGGGHKSTYQVTTVIPGMAAAELLGRFLIVGQRYGELDAFCTMAHDFRDYYEFV